MGHFRWKWPNLALVVSRCARHKGADAMTMTITSLFASLAVLVPLALGTLGWTVLGLLRRA